MTLSQITVRRTAAVYGLSLFALALAVSLRYALDPWMRDSLPLVTVFAAVAAAVWLGGYRPAALVTLAGYAACSYLFIQPRGYVGPFVGADLIGFVAYAFTCALVIAFGEAARLAHAQASERREVLRVTLSSIGDAVITTDNAARVTYLNAVAESLTGWSRERRCRW
jgi:PAS domain-containing protein